MGSRHIRILLSAAGMIVLVAFGGCSTTQQQGPPPSTPTAPSSPIQSVIAVASVHNQAAAVAWYTTCLQRGPDVVPAEGVAEWQLAPNAWLQVTTEPEHAGHATVIVMVNDLDAQRSACSGDGVSVGEVNDYGVVKTAEAKDPDGNRLVFVQEMKP